MPCVRALEASSNSRADRRLRAVPVGIPRALQFLILGFLLLAGCAETPGDDGSDPFPPDPPVSAPVLSQTEAAEAARTAWRDYWAANMGGWGGLGWSAQADELTSASSAYGLWLSGAEPRNGWVPNSANEWHRFTLEPWRLAHQCQLGASKAIHTATSEDVEFSDAGPSRAEVEGFARFARGLCLGTLAMRFRQAFSVGQDTSLQELSYAELNQEALDELYLAAGIASGNILEYHAEDEWIYGLEMNENDLLQLSFSFAARFRASVPRTQAERAAADWDEIRRLASQGIQEDHAPIGDDDGAMEWSAVTYGGQNANRAMADYRTVGPADLSGRYAKWLATDPADRRPFQVETNDRRIQYRRTFDSPPGFYFAQLDTHFFRVDRGHYLTSRIQFIRWSAFAETSNGPMPHMVKAEMDLLQEEAVLRAGGGAGDLINKSRLRAGLPPVGAGDPVGTPADGSWRNTAVHAAGTSRWAKLQHEFRMETFGTGGALAWATDRGWDDLVEGTPSDYPPPESRTALRLGLSERWR